MKSSGERLRDDEKETERRVRSARCWSIKTHIVDAEPY